MKVITLQRPTKCADCGVDLPAGTKARYYSAEKIYCESHDEPAARETAARPAQSPVSETDSLFQDDSPDPWLQFLEKVQVALLNYIGRLKE